MELQLELGELIALGTELPVLGFEELLAGGDLGRRVGGVRVHVLPDRCHVLLFGLQGLGLLLGDQGVE